VVAVSGKREHSAYTFALSGTSAPEGGVKAVVGCGDGWTWTALCSRPDTEAAIATMPR
jgi:hypothetical protein